MNNTSQLRAKFAKGILISLVTLVILLMLVYTATAQKTLVVETLARHGIDQSVLHPATLRAPDNYAYDLKETTIIAGKKKVILAKFDPSRTETERWTVLSIDGKAPSKSEINTFRKGRAQQSPDKTDEKTYKLENAASNQLLFSYRMDVASIPKDAAFIKDCRAYLTVDLLSKKPIQLQLVNEKTVKIGPLMSDKFQITTRYAPNEQSGKYFPLSDSLVMDAKFLGKTLIVEVITEYSNYTARRK